MWKMDVTKKVLEAIQRHRCDGCLPNAPISPRSLMYTYCSTEEILGIVADLEEEFDIMFDADEIEKIGEMTVKAFVKLTVEKVGKQKGDQDV